MTLNADELVIAGTGNIYTAPFGTALPASETASLGGFSELGYTTEDGVTFRDAKELRESRAWQSFYPLRRTVVNRSSEVEFSLMQWNSDTLQLQFGGGSVTEVTDNKFRYDPPDPEDIEEFSMVVDWFDGTEQWRLVVRKAMVTSDSENQLTRTDDAVLPVTVGVNGISGLTPWYLLTNSTAMLIAS